MSNKDKDKGAYQTPAWLKRIQEGSWEPEILISGIVLFGLFKIYPLIDEFNYFLEFNSSLIFSGTNANDSLSSILKYANVILILGFVVHLLFRSVWAAFVGLSYVYPKGVNFERLNYPMRFQKHIKVGSNYTQHIIKLEKICSTLFAISFLVFMWLFGLVFFLLLIILGIEITRLLAGTNDFSLSFLDNFITVTIIIMLLDLVTLGSLKRIPYFNRVFYPLYRFTGWITLSFLYRNIYYGLISNHKKWKVSLTIILFFVFSFFAVRGLQSRDFVIGRTIALVPKGDSQYRLDEGNYRDKVKNGSFSGYMHIDSYVCDKSYIELFVVHSTKYEQELILTSCDYENLNSEDGINIDSLKAKCLEKFYGIALDGQLLDDDFIYQRRSETGQDGLLSIVDISELEKGRHQIDLYYDFFDQDQDTTRHELAEQIFFYKAKQTN